MTYPGFGFLAGQERVLLAQLDHVILVVQVMGYVRQQIHQTLASLALGRVLGRFDSYGRRDKQKLITKQCQAQSKLTGERQQADYGENNILLHPCW